MFATPDEAPCSNLACLPVEIEKSLPLAVIVDPSARHDVLKGELGIAAKPVLSPGVDAGLFRGAFAQKLQGPAPHGGVDAEAVAERLVGLEKGF